MTTRYYSCFDTLGGSGEDKDSNGQQMHKRGHGLRITVLQIVVRLYNVYVQFLLFSVHIVHQLGMAQLSSTPIL